MKHNNITIYDAFIWNWAKSSLCDDVIFIASCINHALVNEICWPSSFETVALGSQFCELSGCLGFIDETLVEIWKPWKGSKHLTWFNGHKKIYAMKNIVVLDHHGLFIYIDLGYGGSYHNVNILRHSTIYQEWRQYFTHWDDYFEYLLGDSRCLGEELFIMKRMGMWKLPLDVNHDGAIQAFNKMHVGFKVQVE